MRSRRRPGETVEEAALRLVQEHAADLLRFARRFSHCADDAHDAYQRMLEILVRRLRSDPPAQPLAWMRTVLRHEALALRVERERMVGRVELDLDRHQDQQLEDPAERALGHERLRQAAEALRRLKPQEVTALVLRAEGLSYREICDRTGWTYTRTNRAVNEGRKALRERLGAIESGAECARWLPLLSALADGEATAAELAELRPHLRACPACRATLRDFRAAPTQVAALVPVALLPAAGAADGQLPGHVELALHALVDRATLLAARLQTAFESVPTAKVAAVAASTAALAGGGAAIEQATHAPGAARADAVAVAVSGAAPRLTTIAAPFPPGWRTASRQPRHGGAGGEFGAARTSPPEFVPPAPAVAEFAPADPPAMAAASAPEPAATPASASPSEFGGP
jgi:RNA polymerase sigma factor (sigma-70 family)